METYFQIELTRGQVARVSEEDFDELSKHKWYADGSKGVFYAKRARKNSDPLNLPSVIAMHRVVLPPTKGMQIDHINRDTLDNRRSSLRLATRQQNIMNSKRRSTNKSGFKGVSYNPVTNAWSAQIGVNYKTIYLGSYKTKEEAHAVYAAAAIQYAGEFARAS